jgi:para-aminobenzoate synthetase / 4-amino-4-deoxychorismate lyase
MPSLIFDFPEARSGRPARTVYRDPVRVVVAREVAEVAAAIARVEAAVDDGLHAAGFVAYEAAPGFEPRMRVRAGNRLPLVWFGLFPGPSMQVDRDPSPRDSPPHPGDSDESRHRHLPALTLEVGREDYDAAVTAVREAIAEGRTYQVNLTARFRGRLHGGGAAPGQAPLEPLRLYESLRRAQGAGWHALLDLGREVVVSVSPELFFRTADGRIETRPMKGTRARGRWPEEDAARAVALASSEKDRAENLMIVDLLRNDLGRICETGSITVPRLFDVERYATVWQLTSTIEGTLRPGTRLGGILAALFPCGSVTGAPKISTMELIAELEASPREVYCGAIGVVRPGGDMAFNVPIRTLWLDRETGEVQYGTGGGIVWDSTSESEYDELLAKAVVVREPWPEFRLLETMAARDGRILRLDRHLARMGRSADYFAFPFPEAEVRGALEAEAARAQAGEAQRIRLTLGDDGRFAIDHEPLGLIGADAPPGDAAALTVVLADQPVQSTDRFLFHKTTHRATYESRLAPHPDAFDVLLWNEREEATEFTRGNLVVEIDGRRLTPPLAAGLLPGCFRAELLEAGLVEEKAIPLGDLDRATGLWFINSARRWIPVALGRHAI